jgi:hypothetical protein
MTAPDETKTPDVTEPTTQRGEESDAGYLTGNRSAEPAEVVEELRSPRMSTTSTATASTTTGATSSRSANPVTQSRLSKNSRAAKREALMAKYGIEEKRDRNGNFYFLCRGDYPPEVLSEIKKLK